MGSIMLLEWIFYSVWILNFVFAACELGQRFSNAFCDIDDSIFQLDWYLLPFELQKTLPIIVNYAQQPLVVQFFGSYSCSRNQFKKVSLWYLVIKTITYLFS